MACSCGLVTPCERYVGHFLPVFHKKCDANKKRAHDDTDIEDDSRDTKRSRGMDKNDGDMSSDDESETSSDSGYHSDPPPCEENSLNKKACERKILTLKAPSLSEYAGMPIELRIALHFFPLPSGYAFRGNYMYRGRRNRIRCSTLAEKMRLVLAVHGKEGVPW